MAYEKWIVRQGDSTNVKPITIDGVVDYTIAGGLAYTGYITVLDKAGQPAGFASAIAAHATNGFTVGLLPEHTKTIGVGDFVVVFEISGRNADELLVYRREVDWELKIEKSMINIV